VDLAALFPLLAPLSLGVAALVAHVDSGKRPRLALAATRAATRAALLVACGTVVLAATRAPLVSSLLGGGGLGFSLRVDGLSAAMFCLVAALGAAVIQFSRNYLDGDPRHATFMGDLALTVGCVMLLVLSGNLVQLTIMWSATSVALHRLLLFYPERRGAVVAAKKKFIVARAGDACLVAASVVLVRALGTGDIGALLEEARAIAERGETPIAMHAAAILVVLAAALKAAQFPAHGWLAEMQETPTPVSALLHAGILNGGTFLVVRLAGIVQLSAPALIALITIGGFTAAFASTRLVTESRVKTALAYSSAAHMGFMLFLCGIGAYSVAIVHLVAHSFYKAHAFLSSGSAVDTQRAARVPGKDEKVSVGSMLVSFLIAGGLVLGAGRLLGFAVLGQPTTLALAAVLTLGLGHLIAQGLRGELSFQVFGRSTLSAAATALSFFALELGGAVTLGHAIPEVAAPGAITLGLTIAVLLSFALVSFVQVMLPSLSTSRLLQSVYVQARNGLYANAYFDRLIGAARLPASRPQARPFTSGPRSGEVASTGLLAEVIDASVSRVTKGFAPVWPLEHFVAVNPFLGLAERSFADAAQTMARVAGARMTMPRPFYAEALTSGRIGQTHLSAALDEARAQGLPGLPTEQRIGELARAGDSQVESPLPTVADVVSEKTGTDWVHLVTDRFGAWAANYFDQGQASWPSPWRTLGPYAAWRAEAMLDATLEIHGARDFRRLVERLPADAPRAIEAAIARLGISAAGLDPYLQRLLYSVGGWAAYARHLVWDRELYGKEKDDTLEQVLAVRLGWEVVLLEAFASEGAGEAWSAAREAYVAPSEASLAADLTVDLVLQSAYEKAWQESLVGKLAAPKTPKSSRKRARVQAAFCIDVRSEVYRRALEAADPECETIGFAGFFGFPIEYVPLGHARGLAQCPVLLTTNSTVIESVVGAADDSARRVAETRIVRRRAKNAWKAFKSGAIACFSFVGPVGLVYAPKLLADALGLTRTVPHPSHDNIDADAELGPSLARRSHAGREVGLTAEQRVAMAEGLLRGMSLTSDFARVVMLVGHGSTTVNNPHAAGLDCGACGGHTGEANARVAAAVLSETPVREALAKRGIVIPEDTIFLGCLHDTTTDEVRIFDRHAVPATHASDLEHLLAKLADAGARARGMRAPLLGEAADTAGNTGLLGRSRDWSQVRPEWGLAGCAAFIVAPRDRTKGVDFEGRSFLHSYDWKEDAGFGVLELVMTAPMVVGSWISLQYYASTVDNRAFGCGNKVLHNVVGTVGVLEGNGGDLRVGLPWQSVHDGERLVHEPMRLNVVIEAPIEAMNAILAKHPSVRALVDNGWLHLYALGEAGHVTQRYAGGLTWEPVAGESAELAA
jgi:uncharacterized protein YbcC (UPF0753/DUF2309 family)/NADH:ubiquinone oxidoreductase subunit 5 (subunit L)/multisubunit Na+/H+ antiporter MnhA subunit